MAQTKPKAAQFYGVSGDGTAGQVLISDGNGGMSWGANTEQFTVSWATPTGQSLTYTQPNPQSSQGTAGSAFPSTTFTATPPSGEVISGTATIVGLPTGITATQSLSGSGVNNVLTVTLTGVFPGADSLNTALTISGLTIGPPLTVDYLVVAGGGGGGNRSAGGGGAGGYRNSYASENSGGNQSSESSLSLLTSTNYTVTVGAGGGGGAQAAGVNNNGAAGSNSIFASITSTGGGYGQAASNNTGTGGSGGGGGHALGTGGTAVTSPVIQGFDGGDGGNSFESAGGGGGAGSVGADATTVNGTNGGNGLSSSITGSPITRAGGGGGGCRSDLGRTPGSGGTGGGGNAGAPGNAGSTNTGSGGGGGTMDGPGGGDGGSGVVIIRYPNAYTVAIGAGLTGSTATDGSDKVTTFTGGTGNIQFN